MKKVWKQKTRYPVPNKSLHFPCHPDMEETAFPLYFKSHSLPTLHQGIANTSSPKREIYTHLAVLGHRSYFYCPCSISLQPTLKLARPNTTAHHSRPTNCVLSMCASVLPLLCLRVSSSNFPAFIYCIFFPFLLLYSAIFILDT